MTTPVYIYIAYTIISIAMTVRVARTLHKTGVCFCLRHSRAKRTWLTQ